MNGNFRCFLAFIAIGALFFLPEKGICYGSGESGYLAAGIVVGTPTGVSIKRWIDNRAAIDILVSFLMKDRERFYCHVKYMIHDHDFLMIEAADTPVYYGGGVVFGITEDDGVNRAAIGLGGAAGVEYLFPYRPLGLFFDLGPYVRLSPEFRFILTGGAGVRYYF